MVFTNRARQAGFTLVEMIVVIAILAILAGAAVPVYAGYITKAREAADYTWLNSAKTAVIFAVGKEDPGAKVVGAVITFADADDSFSVSVNYSDEDQTPRIGVTVDITDYVGDAYEPKSGAKTATWDGSKWTLE